MLGTERWSLLWHICLCSCIHIIELRFNSARRTSVFTCKQPALYWRNSEKALLKPLHAWPTSWGTTSTFNKLAVDISNHSNLKLDFCEAFDCQQRSCICKHYRHSGISILLAEENIQRRATQSTIRPSPNMVESCDPAWAQIHCSEAAWHSSTCCWHWEDLQHAWLATQQESQQIAQWDSCSYGKDQASPHCQRVWLGSNSFPIQYLHQQHSW